MACKKSFRLFIFLLATLLFSGVLADCSTKEIVVSEPEPEPVPEPVVEREPTLTELAAVLDAAWQAGHPASTADSADAGQDVLFTAPVALPAGDRLARKNGTALGGFLADAEYGFLTEHGIETDFAFVNAELIRAGLPEGPVTKQDIERVLPFSQKIVVAEMNGSQLRDLFAEIGAIPQGAGGFAQVSDEVSYTLTFDEMGFGSQISDVLVGGFPINGMRTYRVALNDFIAAGGNGYNFFLRNDIVKAVINVELAEAVVDYCSTSADSLYMKQGERITIQGGIAE